MKIVAVVPTHKRFAITIETVRNLKERQTVPVEEVIVVGDSYEDKVVAQITDSIFLEYENQPLGAKMQAGVDKSREFSPDVLLICGSDSWLSKNWCGNGVEKLSNGADYVGSSTWYFCQALPRTRAVVTKWRSLKGQTAGSGRMISSKSLDKVDWQIYSKDKCRGLDGPSEAVLQKSGMRLFDVKGLAKMLDIKGPWGQMHPLAFISESKDVKQEKWEIRGSGLRLWLKDNFPDSIWSLQKTVDQFKL